MIYHTWGLSVLGAIMVMIGLTFLVFAVWSWAPWLALHFVIFPPIITLGLFVGVILFVIGLILIASYKTEKKHLNDLGEIVGLLYGGFMIYMWLTDYILVPIFKSIGIDIMAEVKPLFYF